MVVETAANYRTTVSLREAIEGRMGAQVAAIASVLREGWEIDWLDSDEDMSLLLTPLAQPRTDTTFLVEICGHRFVLSVLRDDRLDFQGNYGSVNAMVAACMACWATCREDEFSA